jgi:hypothetical protein
MLWCKIKCPPEYLQGRALKMHLVMMLASTSHLLYIHFYRLYSSPSPPAPRQPPLAVAAMASIQFPFNMKLWQTRLDTKPTASRCCHRGSRKKRKEHCCWTTRRV